MDRKEYCFGGKYYEQLPIVLGQLRLLEPIIGSLELRQGESAIADLIRALGGNLHRLMAILLVEKGASVREAMQSLEDRQQELEWTLIPEECIEVVEDFFECNRISSLFVKIKDAVQRGGEKINAMTISNAPSFTSPEEISPSVTASSGSGPQSEPSTG